jgi:hypothetical protein
MARKTKRSKRALRERKCAFCCKKMPFRECEYRQGH